MKQSVVENYKGLVGHPAFSAILDHIRWISAFVVLVGHARNKTFVSYAETKDLGIAGKFFYTLTNLQNEAVICFFVISGLLVGGKLLAGYFGSGPFIGRFVIDRLTRLYIVLLPTMALTYLASLRNVCAFEDASLWIGALLFLQDILVPVTHCNDPLWSLSNEFWYYAIGLLFVLSLRKSRLAMLMLLLTGILLWQDVFNAHGVLLYFPFWLVGMAVFVSFRFRVPAIIPFAVFIAAVLASRTHALDAWFWFKDSFIAFSLGAFLVTWAVKVRGQESCGPIPLPRFGKTMANFSFSLYLTHWPVLHVLIQFLPESGRAFPLDPKDPVSYGLFALLLAATLGFAFLFSLLTEAQTGRLRNFLCRILGITAGVGVDNPKEGR